MSRKILAALTKREWDDFLPGKSGEWLREQPGFTSLDTGNGISPEKWKERIETIRPEVLVTCWSTPTLPSTLLENGEFPGKFLCNLSGSVRRLVPRPFIEKGLLVTNWGDSISPTVAECALFLILSSLRGGSHWAIEMHKPEATWKTAESRNLSLIGRRVGLHGFGAIARALIPLLKPFNTTVSAYSPSVPDELFASHGVSRAHSLEELFAESDVLVELAPNTPANHHIVNEKLLRMLPENGVFVNVGRGPVVDEAALARVAAEGNIFVGLDVYEQEPLPADSPLRAIPDITLLPHLGGPTNDRRRDAGSEGIRNIRAYLNGDPLNSVVNLNSYDRAT
jgi:phosphoglycerate dehydrogenase-like enzyme